MKQPIRYSSTRSERPSGDPNCSLSEAIRRGLAPDGGLYLPDSLAPLTIAPFTVPIEASTALAATAFDVLVPFLADEFSLDSANELVHGALNFPVPLAPLEEGLWHLELFHGPTLAFKDVGARTLARLFSASTTQNETITVLAATSGDTGGAVASAFHRVPNTRVVVLYPKGLVSDRQERQFATLGDNIHSFAVNGTFDDCQRLVKDVLSKPTLVEEHGLTSANSISIGRLLPQITYYVHAFRQLPLAQRDRAVFVVPSGNFGNLTAGILAKRSGLPIRRFVAAVNANDVVPEYLNTGKFSPRPSVRTLANAMDVGNPSNLERIRTLYQEDLESMRQDIHTSTHSDEAIQTAIRTVYRQQNIILDPHTAVGWLAWQEYKKLDPEAIGVLLGTAHPTKFHDIIEPLIEQDLPVPARLAEALGRPLLSERLEPSSEAFVTALSRLS